MSELKPLPTEDERNAIREGVRAVVTRFDDDYWLERDEDGKFPREFHRAMADGGWLGITMPEEYGGAGLGVTEAAIMMHEVASHGGGHGRRFDRPHQPVRSASDRREGHARAEGALGPASDLRSGSMRLRLHRAGRRPQHDAHQDLRRKGSGRLCRARAEGLDLDRAGRQQDHAADPHDQIRGLQAPDRRHHDLLHRPRPRQDRRAAHPEDGPQGGRFERRSSSMGCSSPRRTASARRARASPTSCTASIPSAS